MKRGHMKRRVSITALLVASVLTLGAPQAEAVLLLPGTTVGPDALLFPGGTELDSLQHTNATLGPVSATLRTAVYRNSRGLLDFYYQATNESVREVLRALTAFSFEGFRTDVYNLLNGSAVGCSACTGGSFLDGTEPYVTADRPSTGTTVGFNFGPEGPTRIQPGETTVVLLIRTNATDYTDGLMSVIDGATITRAAFAPTPGAVPEPATLALFGIGLLGSAAAIRRRQRS